MAALLEAKTIETGSDSGKATAEIEAAFAEYCNREKHADNGRVLVGDSYGNNVFEKLSRDADGQRHPKAHGQHYRLRNDQ